MSSLYKINEQINAILDTGFYIDEVTGEFYGPEELEALQVAQDEKIESIACYIKNLTAEVEALKAEETSLAERRKAKERKIENIKEYLTNCLRTAGKAKFETSKCALSFRKSTAVEISDTFFDDAPDWLIRIKKEPDKTAIKKLLQSGQAVKGAALIEKESLQVK